MFTKMSRHIQRAARVRRIRSIITGTPTRPRLAVFRSLTSINVQLIDDTNGKTLASATDRGLQGTRIEKAKQVGEIIAKKTQELKIKNVIFDRAGYQYQGRVAALATGAREAGLQF